MGGLLLSRPALTSIAQPLHKCCREFKPASAHSPEPPSEVQEGDGDTEARLWCSTVCNSADGCLIYTRLLRQCCLRVPLLTQKSDQPAPKHVALVHKIE